MGENNEEKWEKGKLRERKERSCSITSIGILNG
jgi:hypothetical protein